MAYLGGDYGEAKTTASRLAMTASFGVASPRRELLCPSREQAERDAGIWGKKGMRCACPGGPAATGWNARAHRHPGRSRCRDQREACAESRNFFAPGPCRRGERRH
ncbi:hypothetical protein COCCADRAFT_29643 [Bipolaris zeicola 26-R-13]|uniref:Uncharacterized protein n=1 Tax=Cochliobolus carbonum (strain 26-R-13) TaxID=930089 RepID=W6XPI4_COCC2|nr:uncharacterized protein COCCADRAFT_29643 [Bipolaris zeicola 26-R-13]EUC29257.1 hypothetical protein COCCADRAFT_29643 [Bipolaris zeicola 26-R-13]